jgi:ABC-2 type transport system ATP-binding protein
MIHLHEAFKSFDRTHAVRGVSFELAPGGTTALLGPNGAGKTTTIRMITGFLTPDSGTIRVAGHDLASRPRAARRRLGYLPESAPLYPEMTPTQYLDYRARLFNLGRTDRRRAIARALDRCRLAELARRPIGVLSKGSKQRVALASALLHDPPVLILDEPTNGLDPSQARTTRELIRELAADRTVLLSTHLIAEAERVCDRLLLIAAGRLVADDTPARLGAGAPRHELICRGPDDAPFRAALASALPGAACAVEAVGEGWVRVVAERPDDRPAGEALGRAAEACGRGVRHLAPLHTPLEERVLGLIERAESDRGITP